MAENNRDTEHFVLGLIVAAIVYFLFRRQLDNALGISHGNGSGGAGGGSGSSNGGGADKGCGCGCGGGQPAPTNPGISLGNQSYNGTVEAFSSSTVAAVQHGGATFSL